MTLEYKVERNPKNLETVLNYYSRDGWELDRVIYWNLTYIFKRRLPDKGGKS